MELIHVSIEGFRRFAERCTIRMDGHVFALVGPNEAGKSSFLHALIALNDDEALPSTDVTRGTDLNPRIEAAFLLDDADREALGHIDGGNELRACTLIKEADGYVHFRTEPTLDHPTEPREHLLELLEGAEKLHPLRSANGDRKHQYKHAQLGEVRHGLSVEASYVSARTIKQMRALADRIATALKEWDSEANDTQRCEDIVTELREVASHEDDPAPVAAEAILRDRRPLFVDFDEPSRNLLRHYDVRAIADQPPVALANLARLARLHLPTVRDALERERPADWFPLIESANKALREAFAPAWVQSNVVPILTLDAGELHLLVRTPDGELTSPIDERSDGLRWFVALLAFLSASETGPNQPVLLVDEAETHLSYDSQASLVEVLASQSVAQKTIYTTHSAGCLPPDLGTSIRPVVPVATEERSAIKNAFWHLGPGFTPLMLAMGASALAFTPARNVVVGEGPSECILLPTLLRQATGLQLLEFQVAPGVTQATEETLPQLLDSGARVVFLLDADEGGRSRRTWLLKNGTPENRITLYDDASVGLVVEAIEDLLSAEAYASAVNSILDRYSVTTDQLTAKVVPDKGRAKWLREWCFENEIGPKKIQKPVVCQEVITQLQHGIPDEFSSVVDERHKDGLVRLHEALLGAFGTASTPVN